MKFLSVAAMCIMLMGQLSPAAAGMLLCVGDGTNPDCCSKPHGSQEPRVDDVELFWDGSDCGCCITVDAASPSVGERSHKVSLHVAYGLGLRRNGFTPTVMRNAGVTSGDAGNTRLVSLRSIVLLI